jgi:hypothetical protein
MTKPCPSCHGVMEKHTGTVDEPVFDHGKVVRKAHPATFYACTSCEHCEEIGR